MALRTAFTELFSLQHPHRAGAYGGAAGGAPPAAELVAAQAEEALARAANP